LPIEQTKLRIADQRADEEFSIVRTAGGASVTKRKLKKLSPSRPMKPASRKAHRYLLPDIAQSARKLSATAVHLRRRGRARALPAPPGVLARLLFQPRRDEQPQHDAIRTIRITPPRTRPA